MPNPAPEKRAQFPLLLAAALGVTAASTAPARADWGQEDGDAARTGYAGGTLDPAAQPLWSIDYNPFNSGAFKAPAAGAGRLFLTVGRNGGYMPQPELRAFNLFTGQSLWTTPAPTTWIAPDVTAATYANNKVYVHVMGNSGDRSPLPPESPVIYSFDPRTGARTTFATHQGQSEDTRVTVNDDFVFADTGYYGGTGGWSARAATTPWARTEYDLKDTFLGDLNYNRFSTAANNATLYLYRGYRQGTGAPYGRLVGMDQRTGATTLDYTVPGTSYTVRSSGTDFATFNAHLALGSANDALLDYVQGTTNYVASIGLTGGGAEQWRAPLDSDFTHRIAVANGVVFAQTSGTSGLTAAHVYALSEATGKLLWTWTLPQGTFGLNNISGPLIVTDNRLLVSSNSPYVGSNVYSIDIATGAGGVYIPGQAAVSLSDGVLLTRGPGGYDGGKLNAYRVSSIVTTTHTPLVDGLLQVAAGNTTADGDAVPTVKGLPSNRADGLLEFDVSGIPADARITSITLKLNTLLVGGQLGGTDALDVLGYHADALLNPTDAATASTLLGTAPNVLEDASKPSGPDPLTISLDPETALALAGPDGLLGLRLQTRGGLGQYAFSALESDLPAPELAITYSVPEPTTATALLPLLGLAATARRRRRR